MTAETLRYPRGTFAREVIVAEQTGIEWCDATFNPWWGCERVSPGCAHCYADTLAARYGFGETWGDGHGFRFFGDKHWAEPLKWARLLPAKLGRRPRVFCASMADVFEERDELAPHRHRLFELIAATPELDWLLLTKRPEFARDCLFEIDTQSGISGHWITRDDDYFGWGCLSNIWIGTSIENARFTWRADVLREIPASVRFISAEPLLDSLFVEASRTPGAVQKDANDTARRRAPLVLDGIDWIIVGGESGPKARPFHLEHAREIVRACRDVDLGQCGDCADAGCIDATSCNCWCHMQPAVFVKQVGAKPVDLFDDLGIGVATERSLKLRDRKGGDWDEWPADLRIREFPRSAG